MAKEPISDAAREFGERVRARRIELGKSQEELARDSSLHWSYIGQVERGQRNPTLHNILKLAEVLGVDPGVLVRGLRAPDAARSSARQVRSH
jgi:transcriptional regulator with XRE-family HTH domain